LVLLGRYALAESAAAFVLADESVVGSGIEVWGKRLLADAGKDWSSLSDGMAGIVEVAVVRNHLAHGDQVIDDKSMNRLNAAGAGSRWKVGARIDVDDEIVERHQFRLKNLLRISGLNATGGNR
jgi:hypothetical protein